MNRLDLEVTCVCDRHVAMAIPCVRYIYISIIYIT
jgi:hypothetical protein